MCNYTPSGVSVCPHGATRVTREIAENASNPFWHTVMKPTPDYIPFPPFLLSQYSIWVVIHYRSHSYLNIVAIGTFQF